ncbi:MAG: hypothetical protein KAV99_06790 [Candidatus Latescibacteria bacterium]|nr:hypothetical protein [Candidatus Latescibacterota bacterium]
MPPFSHNPTTEKKPKLLDQVRFAIQAKHYSLRTEEAYTHVLQQGGMGVESSADRLGAKDQDC